jgi:hypothetical protein
MVRSAVALLFFTPSTYNTSQNGNKIKSNNPLCCFGCIGCVHAQITNEKIVAEDI